MCNHPYCFCISYKHKGKTCVSKQCQIFSPLLSCALQLLVTLIDFDFRKRMLDLYLYIYAIILRSSSCVLEIVQMDKEMDKFSARIEGDDAQAEGMLTKLGTEIRRNLS